MGKKNTIVPDKKLVEEMVSEYNELKIREKLIKDRKAVLADAIKSYSLANGTKDDNGSFYSDCDGFTYGAQCKKSVKFDDDKAVMFFQSKGYEDCVKLVPQIVESAVEKRFNDGDITTEELESITKTSVSYAVTVKAKEEVITEVQQTSIAAKKKPCLKRK